MTQPVFDLPEVQGLRFRGRHVSQTIASYVRQSLSARGWGDRDKPITDPVNQSLNFGSEQPLWYISTLPEFVDPAKVTTNMVAITLGDEGEDELEQLGGGLYSVTYPLTVDIYGETASGSLSIAGDVKAVLSYRALPVYDFSDVPTPVEGEHIEFESVRGPAKPERAEGASGEFRRHWRSVTADVIGYFSILGLD
jgi:hypothetical protein